MSVVKKKSESKVFDWVEAARILRVEGALTAYAGLGEDWGYTADIILRDGIPVTQTAPFLASTWATPTLEYYTEIFGLKKQVPCYKKSSELPGWDSGTVWPDVALDEYGIIDGKLGAKKLEDGNE